MSWRMRQSNQRHQSVQVNDADSKKIQELFAKERQCMTAQMQGHIREVNYMFADERKSVNVTRNMMVAISVTMSSVFWFFFTKYFCGCRRCRNDGCTVLWKMTSRLILGFRLKSAGCLIVYKS